MTTSHYEVYGTLPTMTEKEKEDMLSSKELPSVSPSDNGKILKVVNGKWSAGNETLYTLPEAGEETLGGVHQAANIEDSTATTVAGLKENFNALLAALKTAGIMVADTEEQPEEQPEG